MSEAEGIIEATPEKELVTPECLRILTGMTDGVLAKYILEYSTEDTFTELCFQPVGGDDIKLKIIALQDDQAGFNTHPIATDLEGADNSKRWIVTVDDGELKGAAFNRIGTVYADGRFSPGLKLVDLHDEYGGQGIARYTLGELEVALEHFYNQGSFDVEARQLVVQGAKVTTEGIVQYMKRPNQKIQHYDTDPDTY